MSQIISIIFWILAGIWFFMGSQFQYHEQVIGICAFLIGVMQLLTWLKSNQN